MKLTENKMAAGITATVKMDGKDAPWLVFHGAPSEVRSNIIEAFGMDAEAVQDWTVLDLTVEASRVAKAQSNVAHGIGGRPLTKGEGQSKAPEAWEAARSGQVEPEPEQRNPLFDAIEQAGTVDELKALWADNKAAFSDGELMAAWKARGKSLQAAA